MGITFGDHMIDSGCRDITPEQEREIDMAREKERVLASWDRVESDDPPLRWLLGGLRDIAETWASDPQQPLNHGGTGTHICSLAADLIEAAQDFRERMNHAESVLEEKGAQTGQALDSALEYVEADLRERFSVSGQNVRDELRAAITLSSR